MKETKLTAKMRTAKGKAASGRMRREGWFPAVVYGAGRPGMDVQLNTHDFVMVLRDHHSENLIVDLAVEGQEKPYKVMVKAMQHHPLNGRVLHVDFCEINMSKKISFRSRAATSIAPSWRLPVSSFMTFWFAEFTL